MISACEKPEKGIGGELLPDGDDLNVFYTDTISVVAYNSILPDSVRTSPVSTGLLGSYWDPMLGKHSSELYFELRLPSSNVDFGGDTATLVTDSVVLALDYTGSYYGKLNPISFEAYELTENLDLDSIYYSNDVVGTLPENLVDPAMSIIDPDPESTITVGEALLDAQMRIHMKTSLGDRFLDPMNTDSLLTADVFRSWFKGLHVKSEADNSAIFNIDLINPETKLTVYYHIEEPDTNIAREFDLLINTNGQRFNHYKHDYSGSVAEYYLNDSTLGQQRLFLQAAAGQSIELDIPYLENWKDSSNIAINKALLVFPIEDIKNDLNAPSRIFAIRFDEDTLEASIPDITLDDSHSDGFLDLENKEYRVNITRYIQQVLTGEIDHRGLRIKPSFNASNFNRVSIFGFENPQRSGKLEFYYTRY
ncbi:MAG: DUF4270 domain-containing protein [Flavobacteriales bacterium]|nr:DUF4270 domain-containing protein [Flavobacteriales bacterium]